MRVELDFYGERVVREFVMVGERAEHAEPAMYAMGLKVMDIVREQFYTEGAASGHPWDHLAESTIQRKGGDASILFESGDLFGSLTELGYPGQIFDVGADSLDFGTHIDYFKYHQSRKPREHLPRRAPFDFTEHDKRELMRIPQRWIVGGVV